MGIEGGGAGHKQPSSDSKLRPTSIHKTSLTITESNQKLRSQSISNPLHSKESTSIETEQISQHNPQHQSGYHQVIAVSASKGPAAFFNLARKFLATDDVCDLSALEGAIVSAVDAAHLLERSKIADIVRYAVNIYFEFLLFLFLCLHDVISFKFFFLHACCHRIQTSYVPVEPKRKSQQEATHVITKTATAEATIAQSEYQFDDQLGTGSPKKVHLGKKGAPLRRSRIIITVKRTDDYRQWLEDNPYHSGGHGDDIEDAAS